ncbi:MAG: hypothetical protein Tsb0021_16920 [Chlamydiales bacterium]
MLRTHVICIFILLFGSSCGYRFSTIQDMVLGCRTISVPYIIGDDDGEMTSALIHCLTASGYRYQKCHGEIILFVSIVECRDENVGFRYDRKKSGELTRSIIPAETRMIVSAQVRVIDAEKGCDLIRPFYVRDSIDFDHEYYSSREGINVFSLGQVTDIDGGRESAWRPLKRKLAQKVVDYLSNIW